MLLPKPQLLRCEGHTGSALSVGWDPKGERPASASDDNTVRIWEAASRRCLAIQISTAEGWVAFRADGRYKFRGNIMGTFWHQAGLSRFEPGELDSVFPRLRLNEDEALY